MHVPFQITVWPAGTCWISYIIARSNVTELDIACCKYYIESVMDLPLWWVLACKKLIGFIHVKHLLFPMLHGPLPLCDEVPWSPAESVLNNGTRNGWALTLNAILIIYEETHEKNLCSDYGLKGKSSF